MNTCGTCKFKGKSAHETESDEPQSTYFLCGRIKKVPNYWAYPPGEKALAKDGSGYYAALCVEDDFGCVLWESAQP